MAARERGRGVDLAGTAAIGRSPTIGAEPRGRATERARPSAWQCVHTARRSGPVHGRAISCCWGGELRAGARIVFQGARAGCGLAVAPRDGFALRSADAGTVPWARVRGAAAPEGAAGRVAGLQERWTAQPSGTNASVPYHTSPLWQAVCSGSMSQGAKSLYEPDIAMHPSKLTLSRSNLYNTKTAAWRENVTRARRQRGGYGRTTVYNIVQLCYVTWGPSHDPGRERIIKYMCINNNTINGFRTHS
jgi:hypothetical protein